MVLCEWNTYYAYGESGKVRKVVLSASAEAGYHSPTLWEHMALWNSNVKKIDLHYEDK